MTDKNIETVQKIYEAFGRGDVATILDQCTEDVDWASEADSKIAARPWGRIEGVARVGSKPAAGAAIRYFSDRLGNPDVPYVSDSGATTADEQGRFVLEGVVPAWTTYASACLMVLVSFVVSAVMVRYEERRLIFLL